MDVKYYVGELEVPSAQWVCTYCKKPLGLQAVTQPMNLFAHPECDPMTESIRHMVNVVARTVDEKLR